MFWEACMLYLYFTAVGSWQAMTYKPLNSLKAKNIWVWIFTAQIISISITPPCVKLLDRHVWIWNMYREYVYIYREIEFWGILQKSVFKMWNKNRQGQKDSLQEWRLITWPLQLQNRRLSLTHAAIEMILLFITREICAVRPHMFEIKLHISVFLALRWG